MELLENPGGETDRRIVKAVCQCLWLGAHDLRVASFLSDPMTELTIEALFFRAKGFAGVWPPGDGQQRDVYSIKPACGNRALVPLILAPTQSNVVTTIATSVATIEARSGTSYQRRMVGDILFTWR